jgi:hypothetical protein
MADRPFTQADLDALAQWDTPTICNGLEITSPERRAFGYTVEPMVCLYPKAKPIVGLARVGMIRSTEPPRGKVTDRADWYEYVAATDFPTIAVIQDIDGRTGYGAYWGEVQSNIHKALGSIGCVTNGSFRDLDMWAEGYQMVGGRIGPSRAVNIFGMQVGHDDVIHSRLPRRGGGASRCGEEAAGGDRSDLPAGEGDPGLLPRPRLHGREVARGAEAVGRDPLRRST